MDSGKIIQHLVDISMGVCSITEASILKTESKDEQMIELGLLTLFEEIEYNRKSMEGSIREKEMLLKEIHHRVKNNLQIISSLLNLQQLSVNDEKAKLILRDCRSRVNTMSIIHKKLLNSNDLGNVNCKEYLEELAVELKISHSFSPKGLRVQIDIPPLRLGTDTAIPLGLLVNEILTNSMKHGLNEDGKNEIYLRMREVESNGFELKIGDNGSGYSNEIFNTDDKTLGVQLIRDLTAQLGGTIEKLIDPSRKGTHYHICFGTLDQ